MLEARGTSGKFYLHLTRWTVGDCLRFALRWPWHSKRMPIATRTAGARRDGTALRLFALVVDGDAQELPNGVVLHKLEVEGNPLLIILEPTSQY